MSPRRLPTVTLPPDLDHVRGLRAARWTRESTGKVDPATGKPTGRQWDNFGPDAQHEQQERAIERNGLVDATEADPTLHFRVAHSGRTIAETPEFGQMLQRAGTDFDLLVVGYASRFARDLRTAVNARHDMHARGAVILFADEHLLSSDERHWKEWADEAVEAEAYSRKLGRRITEGLEAKRRRLGEPGGSPPFGFRRDGGKPPCLAEVPDQIEVVRSVFRSAAEGLTDREIAARTGLKKTHVSELLTNAIYNGVLRDGNRRPPIIDDSLWTQVQEMRSRHSHRHPGPATYRSYLWSGLIRCRSCGRRLTGHVERYRHVEACEAFRAARPGGSDPRHRGDSYTAATYDEVAPRALAHVVANAALVAEVEDAIGDRLGHMPDQFRLARIRRERQQATRRLEVDRDVNAWKATMERLDREETEAQATDAPSLTMQGVAESLADLQALYTDAEPATKHRIVQALFEQVEVLGPSEVWLYPSVEAEARGWAAAMSGEFRVEVRKTGRGERYRAVMSDAGAVVRFVRETVAREHAQTA
jgi:DNA invertase Pin-like site-specific DNA recombinase